MIRTGPTSLSEVADHMMFVKGDLLDDDEHPSDFEGEEGALEIIRREYVSGTCGAFAIVLHDLTGYPIVGLNGGMHIAVRTPDGEILDFMGKMPLKEVAKRYGMRQPLVREWTREEAVEHVVMDDEPHAWDDITLARWVMNRLQRWTA